MQNTLLVIFFLFVFVMNCISFASMGIDKRLAQRHLRRIPERSLFLYALPFAAPGALMGMYRFRHKTQHAQFVKGMPLLLFAQFVVAFFLVRWML